MRPSRTRQMLIPGRRTVRPDAGTPKISPCCVPLAVKFSTTRSSSSTRKSRSLCQSGYAARNMAPVCRIPSRLAGPPMGGSWSTKSSARYSSTAPRSPLVNRASMNEVTVFLFWLIVSMPAVCGGPMGEGTPTTWGFRCSRRGAGGACGAQRGVGLGEQTLQDDGGGRAGTVGEGEGRHDPLAVGHLHGVERVGVDDAL